MPMSGSEPGEPTASPYNLADVPTVEDYCRAFAATQSLLEGNNRYIDILRFHYCAPNHTVTATQVAHEMDWHGHGAANLHYGKYAGELCRLLGRSPGKLIAQQPGLETVDLAILATFGGGTPTHELVTWTLLPQVVQAVEELGWVTRDGAYSKRLPAYADPTPLATPDEYRKALLVVRDKHRISERDLKMLRAHYRADRHTITAGQLAAALEFKDGAAANLHYGKLAHKLSDALGIEPSKRVNGTVAWWRVIAYGPADRELGDHFEWTMRPELVAALQAMKWA